MKNNRVVILGGGITGLSAAKLLAPYFKETIVLEQNSEVGGLCKTEYIDGVPVDIGGGHIFNTHYEDVKDFVFTLMPFSQWNERKRNAKIWIDDKVIGFPFENHMFEISNDFMNQCLKEMDGSNYGRDGDSLFERLLGLFGSTACHKYYFPYNKKIWQYPLDKVGTEWMDTIGKVPRVNLKALRIKNTTGGGKDTSMAHSTFYYPKQGGIQEALINNLLDSSYEIRTGRYAVKIEYCGKRFDVKDNYGRTIDCDCIVNTTPINSLLSALGLIGDRYDTPYHGTDVIAVKSDFFLKNPKVSWIYVPERKYWWHRMANLSYCQDRSHGIILVEAPGGSYWPGMKIDIPGYQFKIRKVWTQHMTYPIESLSDFDKMHNTIGRLSWDNIFSIGRWGRHQYSNMDVCIKDVMETKHEILEQLQAESLKT